MPLTTFHDYEDYLLCVGPTAHPQQLTHVADTGVAATGAQLHFTT